MGFMQGSAIPKISHSTPNKKKKKKRPGTGLSSSGSAYGQSPSKAPVSVAKFSLVKAQASAAGGGRTPTPPVGKQKTSYAKMAAKTAIALQLTLGTKGNTTPKASTPKFSKSGREKGKEDESAGGSAVRAVRSLSKSDTKAIDAVAAPEVGAKLAKMTKEASEEEKQPPAVDGAAAASNKAKPIIAAVPSSPRSVLSPIESPRSRNGANEFKSEKEKDPLLDSLRNKPTRNNLPPLSAEVSPRGPKPAVASSS